MTEGLHLLHALAEVHAFEPVPLATRRANRYVPFSELAAIPCEESLRDAILRTERTAVIGPVGSGKTSLVQVVVEAIPNAAPFLVSTAYENERVLRDPVEFARHMIRQIVRWARAVGALSEEERMAALNESATLRERRTVQTTDTLGIKLAAWIEPSWSREIQETLADPDVERIGDEILDSLDRVIQLIHDRERLPVVIVDDTDRWLAEQGYDEKRIEGFFGKTCPMLADRNCAVVFAIHPRYRGTQAFRTAAREGYVSCRIEVPGLPSPEAVRLVLDKRVQSAWHEVRELRALEQGGIDDRGIPWAADDAFEEGFDLLLFNWYRDPSRAESVRSILSVAHQTLNEAVGHGDDLISLAALQQTMLLLE